MANVIDISYHNGKIDFDKVVKDGINHVIIRCGYGDNYASQHDKMFDTYMQGAMSAGMYISVYIYSYADNDSHAISEAQHIISQVNKYRNYRKLSKVIWYDLEEEKYKKDALQNFLTFKQYVNANSDYIVGLYTGYSYYTASKLNTVKGYPLWIARYGLNDGKVNKAYEPNFNQALWQYTSKGKVDGISTNVDVSLLYDNDVFTVSRETISDYEEAIIKLTKAGIIASPDYWRNACKVVKYLPDLLINMAKDVSK